MAHSPGLEAAHLPIPTSAPEEEQLQLLPPIVAAGSTSTPLAEDSSAAAPRPRPVQIVSGTNAKNERSGDRVRRDRSPHIDKSQHPHENGGALTPRAKFLETLQSKNTAWDALIHGSFS